MQAVPASDIATQSGDRSRRTGVVPEPELSVPQSVAEILNQHVTFELECIDRMYLNVYVPPLQCESGAVKFFRSHRGHPFASSALMDPMTKAFVAAMERFAKQEQIRWCSSEKDSGRTMSWPSIWRASINRKGW